VRAVDLLPDTADALKAVNAYVGDLLTPTIRLGVTGLARSGKTVFITALIRNLVNGGRLPFFAADAQGRVLRAYLEPQPDDAIPRFEFESHIAALTSQHPTWPESTRRISQLRITFEYLSANPLRNWIGPSKLHLDIVDYPGEWLLDLALIGSSYETWAREALELARAPERAPAADPYLAFLAGLDGTAVDVTAAAAEQSALTGARLYTTYLKADRASDQAQATLGPGRFLMPGELEGSPLLTFCPLPTPSGKPDALYALMARRFESYKSKVVEPFFRDHFSRLDRQIVLIDALGAVNRGGAAVADLERALTQVMASFRPGAGSWLSFLTGRRIDRLLFAATKADHLHHDSHDRLEAILRLAAERARGRAQAAGATVDVMALSAVRATREATRTDGAETLPVIIGVPMAGETIDGRTFDGVAEAGIFPGDLPRDPADAFAGDRVRADATAFVRFRPPTLTTMPGSVGPVLPHIRLDRAIDFLIGDKLA
jgi:uncharacterized protein